MAWYAAHLIEYFKVKEGHQDIFPVWENIILLQADSPTEAIKLAQQMGEEKYSVPDDSWHVDDKPAVKIFLGVRMVVECDNDDIDNPDAELKSGTELTYIKMLVASEDDVLKLARGDSVTVTREDIWRKS